MLAFQNGSVRETDICEAKGTERRSREVTELGESESMVNIDC